MTRVIFYLTTIVQALCFIKSEEVPEFLHICHKTHPELTKCMKNSIEYLRPYLAEGLPKYDIPKLEPIDVGDLLIAESSPGRGITITATEIKAFGCSNFNVEKVKIVEYGRRYNLRLGFPNMYILGQYNLNGRVLFLPIRGNGKFTGNFTNGFGDIKIFGEQEMIDGKQHIVLKKLDIKIIIGKGKIKLDNLFGGDRVLGDVINETINQNFEIFSRDIIPLVEKALERIFKKISNKIVERYTEEQLFPQ